MTIRSQEDEFRGKVMAQIMKANRSFELAVIKARLDHQEWPVKIKVRADERFEVNGRDSGLYLYITETNAGYLASVPNYNRCGHVPADCHVYNVMDYIGIENEVDAATLAAAIRYIIGEGLVSNHPAVDLQK